MHNVGDTIWIISTERPGVMPFLVVEEVIKKSIAGTETSYMVQIPGSDTKPRKLGSIPGEIHTSMDDAKKALLARAERAIDEMLQRGQDLLQETKPVDDHQAEDQLDDTENSQTIPDGEYVILPDGTKAKINFKGDL
jgi:hypothetical protein